MTKQVRELGGSSIEEMFALATYAFNGADTPERRERFRTLAENSWNYGFFDEEDRLTSQVMATPFPVNFYGQEYLMAGIGYVASYPEARGQGGINQIMEKILEDCRDRKVSLSYLAPFSYPFYRRYGYEQSFDKIRYQLNSRDVTFTKKKCGKMKRMNFEDAKAAIKRIYEQMPENQRAGLKREDWWYTYKFKQKGNYQFALYFDEAGEATGYVVYQLAASSFIIVEWGFLNHDAFCSLVRFVSSHNGAFETFEYSCGYGGNDQNYLLANPFASVTITPYMMARVVDISLFLEKYPFRKKQAAFALQIEEDQYAKWNEGIVEVTIKNGKNHLSKVEQTALPIVRGSIQHITQLLLGYRKVEELVLQERIQVAKEYEETLSSILPQQQPILNDYF